MARFKRLQRPAAALAVGALLGCSNPSPTNVLFIVSDALRADSLSCYGGAAATPNICRLAVEGVLFERAYATAPWTLPSSVAMLTGRYPAEYAWPALRKDGRPLPFYYVPEEEPTLIEALAGRGYDAAAVVENHVAWSSGAFQGLRGLAAETVDGDEPQTRRDERYRPVLASARFLASSHGPFFLLHWFEDPHAEYAPPAALLERQGITAAGLPHDLAFYERLGHGKGGGHGRTIRLRDRGAAMGDAELALLHRLYLLEVASVDERVGMLLDALERAGARADTVVVFTADHGEEFKDHGGFLHGHSLHEELVRVPLLLAGPGVPRGSRVKAPVSHVDLVPTLAALLHVDPPADVDGRSLLGLVTGTEADGATRPIHLGCTFRSHPLHGVVDGRFKLVGPIAGAPARLFDLAADPAETRNLAQELPRVTKRMTDALRRLEARQDERRRLHSRRGEPGVARQAAEAAEEQLHALGYLQ